MEEAALSLIGLAGLAVMGPNLALNIVEKGFPISVYNRTASKVEDRRSCDGGGRLPLPSHRSLRDFILSIARPHSIIILVKAGAPVDQTIATLSQFMDLGDSIIDGGNEWYENTECHLRDAAIRGLLYLGMGISGKEVAAPTIPFQNEGLGGGRGADEEDDFVFLISFHLNEILTLFG
ncbi:6-phosphogluconate dehydrogenase, decarboxylating 3, chloroplastic-like [Elaeis guineensis]|uniref:6-phosphogluconate dehydrogenase, decarboxylating 3, chloroplastic-like n=1 Tax=Elaeis guineensis var. tenera TaxID=51953 RepID=A0A6I9SDU7_ELAGV|nr:6-phosphogluconate dehydrogenase, decarboxylating 3, chloroplastic-like [Elaeis guineensis]